MLVGWGVSIRRACEALQFDTSGYHYKSRRTGQADLEMRILETCETCVRYGYRRVHVLLRREGWRGSIKKARRVYNELGLQLRNQRLKRRVKEKLRSECLNAHWFMSLADAREKLEAWPRHYNKDRPRSAIGYNVPIAMHYPDDAASPSP